MKKIKMGEVVFEPSKVVCVGRNYREHKKEMGYKEEDEGEPTIFLKPNSAIAFCEPEIFVPESFGLLHHEVELCFVISRQCKNITPDEALSYIAGWGIGLDLTLRDIQAKAKEERKPWSISKGFDNGAPVGKFVAAEKLPNVLSAAISLKVNGVEKQRGSADQMIFSPFVILSFVSKFITLQEGDLFMTGTPAGVGPIKDGDVFLAEIEGLPPLEGKIRRK
ncbi:MAG: fumarylacetoacetate hydrolase family protein [Myxococcota bacterium]